jgi:hypothetical protein
MFPISDYTEFDQDVEILIEFWYKSSTILYQGFFIVVYTDRFFRVVLFWSYKFIMILNMGLVNLVLRYLRIHLPDTYTSFCIICRINFSLFRQPNIPEERIQLFPKTYKEWHLLRGEF